MPLGSVATRRNARSRPSCKASSARTLTASSPTAAASRGSDSTATDTLSGRATIACFGSCQRRKVEPMTNTARRPSHREYLIAPGGHIERFLEHHPVCRARIGRFPCKYCHTEHRNWWLMSPADYDGHIVILCGRCEYTTLYLEAPEGTQ